MLKIYEAIPTGMASFLFKVSNSKRQASNSKRNS